MSLSTSTFFLTVASPLTGKLTSACPFKTCGPATGIAALLVCGVRECIASKSLDNVDPHLTNHLKFPRNFPERCPFPPPSKVAVNGKP